MAKHGKVRGEAEYVKEAFVDWCMQLQMEEIWQALSQCYARDSAMIHRTTSVPTVVHYSVSRQLGEYYEADELARWCRECVYRENPAKWAKVCRVPDYLWPFT